MMETTQDERNWFRQWSSLNPRARFGGEKGFGVRVTNDADRLAEIERQMRIMARGLRAAEAMRAGSPGTDAEYEQWRHWYDKALALSLTIDAPDVQEGEHLEIPRYLRKGDD